MPCRVDVCPGCNEFYCVCNRTKAFDVEGALCDVLEHLEFIDPDLLQDIDATTLKWWRNHTTKETEKIKKEALEKLTAREKRALGLK